MPRRGQISKRDVLPDPLYGSKFVTKLINNIMNDGKKGVAQKIVYDAFAIVEEKTGKPALDAFQEAIENIMPTLEVGDEMDMDDIYEQFGVDYDLKSLLLYRDVDEEGHFSIRWGEQEIA